MLIDKIKNAIKRWLEISPAAIVKKAAEDTRSLEARLEALFEAIAAVKSNCDAVSVASSKSDLAIQELQTKAETLAGIGLNNTLAIAELKQNLDTISQLLATSNTPISRAVCTFCDLSKEKFTLRGKDIVCDMCQRAGY